MTELRDEWKIEDHACAECLGRVVSRRSETGGDRIYRCAECEVEAAGEVNSICCCGAKIGEKNASVRCVRNDRRSPGHNQAVVAIEMG
jgi:hypothetical protein